MISALISRLIILFMGTLYPAFASYKAIRTKDMKEYVKWMMYWIVFALFIAAETFTDVFLSFWFPFYYEIKIVLVLWLLSPITKGTSIMYRKVIHPLFLKKEKEIDEFIARTRDQSYCTVLDLGRRGVSVATNAFMNTALKHSPAFLNRNGWAAAVDDSAFDITDFEMISEMEISQVDIEQTNEMASLSVPMPNHDEDSEDPDFLPPAQPRMRAATRRRKAKSPSRSKSRSTSRSRITRSRRVRA